MLVRIVTDGVRVPGLVVAAQGEVLDLPEAAARELIRLGDGEAYEPQRIEVREPVIENRDPQPVRVRTKTKK